MENKNIVDIQVENNVQEAIPNEEDKATGTWKIINLIESSDLEIFMDQNNVVQVLLDKKLGKIVELNSDAFKNWILYACYEHDRKPPNMETINKTVKIMDVKMRFSNPETKNLYVRTAEIQPGVFCYDLGAEAVRYDKNGWNVVESPPIFRRFSSQESQVKPVPGKGLDEFIQLFNLESADDELLLKTFIVSSFIPGFPHPILLIHGQQGSAKSTLSRYLKDIIDPSVVKTRSIVNSQEDFTIAMSRNWATFYDNITNLTMEQSDQMCRTSTGEGLGKRKKYTDQDEVIFNFKNILGLNGISCVANKPDLLDRSLIIKLSRIPEKKRQPEKAIDLIYQRLKPGLLAECFDMVVKAIANEPNVKLKSYPRMADFAHWGYSINDDGLDGGNKFIEAYDRNIYKQNERAVEMNPVAEAIINLIKSDVIGEMTATPEYLYKKLVNNARKYDLDYTHDRAWPKNSSWMSKRIEEIVPNLEKLGVSVVSERSKGKRWISIVDKSRKKISNNSFTSGSFLEKEGWQPSAFAEVIDIDGNFGLYDSNDFAGDDRDLDLDNIPF